MKNPLRGPVHPTGQHRAVPVVPSRMAPCPCCARTTYHAVQPDGSRTCWTCWTTAPEGV